MEIRINKLYGIKNKIKFNFESKGCIFAPNGVGKTSLYKGILGLSNSTHLPSMEGDVENDAITIDGFDVISNKLNILMLNEKKVNDMINGANDIIREFLSSRNQKTGFLPGNLYGDFLDIYEDAKSDIEYHKIDSSSSYFEFDFKSINSINRINTILSDTSKLSFSSLPDYKMEIDILEADLEVLQHAKKNNLVSSYKELGINIQGAKMKIYNEFIEQDFEILSLIDDLGRHEYFKYKINNDYIESGDGFEKVKKLLKDNGISNGQIDAYNAYKKNIDNLGGNVAKTSAPIVKKIISKISSLKEDAFNFSIKKRESLFKDSEVEIKKNEKIFIEEYNEEISGLNKALLKTDVLKWKFSIKPISNYHDITQIEVINENDIVETDTLINFASTGQKKIISLLLATINTKGYDLIVFDDVVNSMDSDNISIFIDSINGINTKILILTHNYQLLSSVTKIDGIKSFIMDNNDIDEIAITEIGSYDPLHITNWPSMEVVNKENKVLFAATVIRETIQNYLNPRTDADNDKGIYFNQIIELKKYIENTYRHFKGTGETFAKAALHIKKNTDIAILEMFEGGGWLEILLSSTSEKIISDHVIDFDLRNDFDNLVDYISTKYVLGLKIRFIFEKNILSTYGHGHEWDKGEIKGISRHPEYEKVPENLKKIGEELFMMNHLNNLRWTPIIETPIYKMNKYISIMEKGKF